MEGVNVKGSCENMCPDEEIRMRIREKLVYFYEKGPNGEPSEERMVKEYKRSAAGLELCKAKNLRTPDALRKTVNYLLTRIIRDDRRPFHQAYDFIFDRLRCIRQEIVIANLPEQETLELLEPMIIFLAYSYYQLCDEDISKFDPKICGQHLQECLKKALKCYDDMEVKRGRKLDFAKRPLIESIYLIFNLGSEEAMQRGVTVKDNTDLQFESTFLSTWMISKFCWQGNFFRAIKLTKHLPVLLQGLVFAKHMQGWRECLLRDFSAAYNSPNVSVPNEFLCKVLFVGESSLKSLSLHYNMEDVPKDCLRFSKITHRYDAGALKPQKEIKFTFSSI